MPEKRAFRSRTRPSGLRDARLIIIASEGTNTEKRYFEDLAAAYSNPRVHVEVLSRVDTASSPGRVLQQLNEFRAQYHIQPGYDQLWLVIDVDRWGEEKLSEITSLCLQKKYACAISNPCFEIWFLLHFRELSEYPPAILAEFQANRKQRNRTRLELELIQLLGSYHKSDPETHAIIPHTAVAIQHARSIDLDPDHRWPNGLGTRVYRLVEEIV